MKSISEFLEKWKNRKWSKTDWLICILGGILSDLYFEFVFLKNFTPIKPVVN